MAKAVAGEREQWLHLTWKRLCSTLSWRLGVAQPSTFNGWTDKVHSHSFDGILEHHLRLVQLVHTVRPEGVQWIRQVLADERVVQAVQISHQKVMSQPV